MNDNPITSASQEVVNAELFSELRGLLHELDELSYETLKYPKASELCDLIEKLNQWGCRASKHDWQYDQCGYWQHQYCTECRMAKYPDMAKQSCGELTSKMGKMTESEFLSANGI